MGERVMIIGPSGVGKSKSYENFEADEVGIFNIAGKRPPFRKKLPTVNKPTYSVIKEALRANNRRAYIIDDSTYLMQFAMFEHAKESGYQKFTTMALDFEQLLEAVDDTDDDTIVYAARLAALYSKGRASSRVPVDYTLRRYVKKPGGAKPGFVIYTNQHTLYVQPAEEKPGT